MKRAWLRHIAGLLIASFSMSYDSQSQCVNYNIVVTPGLWPGEVSWNLTNASNVIVASGFAPANVTVCLLNGCYTLNMFDSFGDGWDGSVITITNPSAVVVISTTLNAGSSSSQIVSFGGANCCPAGTAPYTFSVTAGFFPGEVSWELYNSLGGSVLAGGAPSSSTVCLAPDCYTLFLFDAFGDGWDGSQYTLQSGATIIASGTLTNGSVGIDQISVGNVSCGPACSGTDELYQLTISDDFYPSEVYWNLNDDLGSLIANGGAPASIYFCAHPGCYEIEMIDFAGDGWSGSVYTLFDSFNNQVQTGTLDFGFSELNVIEVMGADCGVNNAVTAPDCITAVDVCDNLNFQIDPNGSGLINEIPPPGSLSNPTYFIDGANSPWGTDHYGCLQGGELNSTWMIVNIWQGGLLNFTFGGLGTQAGYYDWIMYPYDPANTCQDVYNNMIPPVRCNWNYASTGGTGLASAIPAGGDPGNYEPPLNVLTGDQYLICFSNWSSVNTGVPLDFGGTAVVGCSELVLPVELVALEANQLGENCLIEWTTSSEQNNDYFEIQHSLDEVLWTTIGRAEGHGTSVVEHKYELLHNEPVHGMNYYRLKQFDFNGRDRISHEVSIDMREGDPLIFPNPTTGLFYVNSSTVPMMRDMIGCQIPIDCRQVSGHLWEIRMEKPSAGVYMVSYGDQLCSRIVCR